MGNLLHNNNNKEEALVISDIHEARAFAQERLQQTQRKLGMFEDRRGYAFPASEACYALLDDVLFDLQYTHLEIQYGDIHSLNKKIIPFLEKLLMRLEKIHNLNRARTLDLWEYQGSSIPGSRSSMSFSEEQVY